jgi:hypothetical protein
VACAALKSRRLLQNCRHVKGVKNIMNNKGTEVKGGGKLIMLDKLNDIQETTLY